MKTILVGPGGALIPPYAKRPSVAVSGYVLVLKVVKEPKQRNKN